MWSLVQGSNCYDCNDATYSSGNNQRDPSNSTAQTDHAAEAVVFSSWDLSLLDRLLSLKVELKEHDCI